MARGSCRSSIGSVGRSLASECARWSLDVQPVSRQHQGARTSLFLMCACSLVLLPGTILINPSHSNLSLVSRSARRHRRSSDIVLVARSLLLLHLGPSCSRSRSRSLGRDIATMHRSFEEESRFIECVEGCEYRIKRGFVPNMNVSIWLAGSRWLSCGANQHEATRSKVASTLTRHYESCSSRSCNRAVRPLASVASCLRYASYLARSLSQRPRSFARSIAHSPSIYHR